MKTQAAKRLRVTAESYKDEAEISFKVTGEAQYSLPRLLHVMAFLGNVGASRTITVEDVPACKSLGIEEGDMKFGIDGDGADKITDIKVNGKIVKDTDVFKVTASVTAGTKRRVFAAEVMENEAGFQITTGANSFKCRSPSDAYQKAAKFINQIEHDGFKFTRNGAMSKKMDVFKKGGEELSISVRDSILNIDLW